MKAKTGFTVEQHEAISNNLIVMDCERRLRDALITSNHTSDPEVIKALRELFGELHNLEPEDLDEVAG